MVIEGGRSGVVFSGEFFDDSIDIVGGNSRFDTFLNMVENIKRKHGGSFYAGDIFLFLESNIILSGILSLYGLKIIGREHFL